MRCSPVLLVLIAGCSSDPSTTTSDAGSGADAGSMTDSGAPPEDAAMNDDVADVAMKPPCAADEQKTGTVTRTYTNKTYYTYAPSSYTPGSNVPLVVALHGAGDKSLNYLNVMWKSVADSKGFVLVVPEGSSPAGPGFTWNTGDRNTILKEIEETQKCYDVNPKKTIIHGFSAGGIMAYWIGLKDANRFSGIAINAANLGSAEAINGASLVPAPWTIPVSHFHGDQDMNFPIASAQQGITKLMNAGHMTYWHPFNGGHTASPQMAAQELDDLSSSTSP